MQHNLHPGTRAATVRRTSPQAWQPHLIIRLHDRLYGLVAVRVVGGVECMQGLWFRCAGSRCGPCGARSGGQCLLGGTPPTLDHHVCSTRSEGAEANEQEDIDDS